MINRKLYEIERMSEGMISDSAWNFLSVVGVSTDTRTLQPGNLFIPIVRTQNGHRFVEEAFRKGAVASLWSRHEPDPPHQVPLIFVDDPLSALHRLASRYRQELNIKVVGVTGSNGKTTTKDMIASVLSRCRRVCKTEGNLNNHYGLPLTLLQMEEGTEIAVVEMGMSGAGEIKQLARIARPDVAVITMIGEAHLASLGSRKAIASAKLEILSGLAPNGTLLFNGDEPLLEEVLAEIAPPDTIRKLRFGLGPANDYSPADIRIDSQRTEFKVCGRSDDRYAVPLPGKHYACNALAAIAVADGFEIPDADIQEGLASVHPSGMRMEVKRSVTGLTVIDDAFNASPSSVKAAIEVLSDMQGFANKTIVLGDMLELGPEEKEMHRAIGRLLSPETIDFVYTYGELAAYIAEEARIRFGTQRALSFQDKPSLAAHLLADSSPDKVVLVKGSRGAGMEEIVQQLLADSDLQDS
ncbi:UDP-N-acetylmuramoyl-tripeptide--D-alanyl-D-alanine ligase [Paenibacillus sp. J2TS4]|uniref:UDP-N-acetylmuramoyl-tripeptide--D-alanyl-D- alanine ligase n=1 Tax=Paenibacillus sp. J2TS4 TaxID=2807194 RepID=UPI001B172047|nr:UDP-N-acetylmuramoyl-tripeptide--D-alanyl-D-alanine ligase [Paenibacillus sp. J2TS4]GIP35301.1 UDP-N-acetylmuramoyl-tripeptide--D-alanyl-D-alanine ligase [Paenibacillus sp. J2TS4]